MKQSLADTNHALVLGEIGLVHSLGEQGIPVTVGSEFKDNPALYSANTQNRYLLRSSYDSDEFVDELCGFGDFFDRKPVLYTDDDRALMAISRNRERLRDYYLFLLPEKTIVEQIQDKRQFYSIAEMHNLPVPASYTISSLEELHMIESEINYPCIIKPVYKEDWWHSDFSHLMGTNKKAIRCKNQMELYSIYKKVRQVNPSAIVQESIEGRDDRHFSINMYVDAKGAVKGHYIVQKKRMYPPGAGMGSFFETIQDDEILKHSRNAVEKFHLRGLVNIQFKRDHRTDKPYLIEIEARQSVSCYLGPACGMNLAGIYYNDLIGKEQPEIRQYQTGVKYSDIVKDIKALLIYRKDEEFGFLDWFRSYRGRVIYNGFHPGDPCPVLMNLWFIVKRRFDNGENTKNGTTESETSISGKKTLSKMKYTKVVNEE